MKFVFLVPFGPLTGSHIFFRKDFRVGFVTPESLETTNDNFLFKSRGPARGWCVNWVLYIQYNQIYYKFFECNKDLAKYFYAQICFCVSFQGIDIRHNKDRKVHRTEPKSQDIYLKLLVKVSD